MSDTEHLMEGIQFLETLGMDLSSIKKELNQKVGCYIPKKDKHLMSWMTPEEQRQFASI
jgi:hypothetical protein